MKSFSDVAGFVLGGMLASVPPCMVVASYFATARLEQRPLMLEQSQEGSPSRARLSTPGGTPEGGAQGVRSERVTVRGRRFLEVAQRPASRSLPQMADAAALLCGVPAPLFRDLIARESSWGVDAVSAAGAVGLAQVMPRSARDVSPTLDVRDPWQNLVAGACLLRQYRDRFGSWRVALHAYHGGPTRVDQRRTTKQSRDYARDVIEGAAN